MNTKQKIELANETLENIKSMVDSKSVIGRTLRKSSVTEKMILTKCIGNWVDKKKIPYNNKDVFVEAIVNKVI